MLCIRCKHMQITHAPTQWTDTRLAFKGTPAEGCVDSLDFPTDTTRHIWYVRKLVCMRTCWYQFLAVQHARSCCLYQAHAHAPKRIPRSQRGGEFEFMIWMPDLFFR